MEAQSPREAPTWTPLRIVVVAALVVGGVYLLFRRELLSGQDAWFFAALIPSVIVHEVSHGALALAFGDDTARRAGRLTLNPLPHVDPLGTVIVPAMLLLATGSPFGWAKPVPVNPRRMRDPRNNAVAVSLVGPGVNVALALLAALAIRASGAEGTAYDALVAVGVVNVVLAAFNLLPIPPLDGSAVVERVLPERYWPAYQRVRQYSFAILLLVVVLLAEPLNRLVFLPALRLWGRLL